MGEDGCTLLQHLVQVEKAKGQPPSALVEYYNAECPPFAEGIYFWWLELNERRGNNGYAELPLSFIEIKAWCDLYGETPSPYQVELILKIDRWYLMSKHKDK